MRTQRMVSTPEHKVEKARMVQDPPETETVTTTRIACDGGEGALGHPRVWLQIDETEGFVECGYCDKKFVLKDGPADRG